jgi:hypothetical protein
MVNAACCPSSFSTLADCSAVDPSRSTTSCDASTLAGSVKRGVGLFPNLAMCSTAVSGSIESGMSRRSLPYRCLDVCDGKPG